MLSSCIHSLFLILKNLTSSTPTLCKSHKLGSKMNWCFIWNVSCRVAASKLAWNSTRGNRGILLHCTKSYVNFWNAWDLITDNILTSEFSCADLEAAFGSRNADSPFSMTARVYQTRWFFSNAKQQYVASKTEEKQLKKIDMKVGWISDQLGKRQTECSPFWGAFGKLLCFVAKPVESHPEIWD